MTTLRDIARACGKDISTVSRALRRDPRVKPETRDTILVLAKRMGYRPNLTARHLVAGKTRTLWFILPSLTIDIEQAPAVHASRFLLEHDYDLMITLHHNDHHIFERLITRLTQGVTDGAIILPGPFDHLTSLLQPLIVSHYPLVFLDRHLPGTDHLTVTTDNTECVHELIRLCLRDGCEAFHILFGTGNQVEKTRRAAAMAWLEKHGLPYSLASDEPTPQPLERKTGLLASTQSCVLGFLERRGPYKPVPCAGVFDQWIGAVTHLDRVHICMQDFEAMARVAVDRILRAIASPETMTTASLIPPTCFKHYDTLP